MAATQEQVPLKSIKDVAEEQALKAAAMVAAANEESAKSARSPSEILSNMMMVRLTDAAIARQRKEAGIAAYEDAIGRLEIFVAGNASNVDPQRILINATKLNEGLKETLTRLNQEPI